MSASGSPPPAAIQAPRALHARAVAQLLLDDRELMDAYKNAAREQRILAISHEGRNYVAVLDQDILLRLLKKDGKLKHLPFDATKRTLEK